MVDQQQEQQPSTNEEKKVEQENNSHGGSSSHAGGPSSSTSTDLQEVLRGSSNEQLQQAAAPAQTQTQQQQQNYRGLLKTLIERFSSTPLDLSNDDGIEGSASAGDDTSTIKNSIKEDDSQQQQQQQHPKPPSSWTNRRSSKKNSSNTAVLTESERVYLEGLLRSGDMNSIEAASQTLTDRSIFPEQEEAGVEVEAPAMAMAEAATAPEASTAEEETETEASQATENEADSSSRMNDNSTSSSNTRRQKRDSIVQQELFRLHQTKKLQPSKVLQQCMASLQQNRSSRNNSLLADSTTAAAVAAAVAAAAEDDDNSIRDDGRQGRPGEGEGGEHPHSNDNWNHDNPFSRDSITAWLDGSQGVEVDDDGTPLGSSKQAMNNTTNINVKPPFQILGTAGDDISCHPHVLSPPLMESLLQFVPESLSESNFWLKYSLVRDGAGLWKMLRQIRASNHTFLAIETTDGYVFGSYTSHAWRLSQGWYGSNESFVWKMRRSRLDHGNSGSGGGGSGTTASTEEQQKEGKQKQEQSSSLLERVVQESEIQVYPYRPNNVAVQYCSKDCLMMGSGELKLEVTGKEEEESGKKKDGDQDKTDAKKKATTTPPPSSDYVDEDDVHYGHAIHLHSNLMHGTSSNSETFGNPCLVIGGNDSSSSSKSNKLRRGSKFDVSNIEVWTLTPHNTVEDAQRTELSTLFLEGGRDRNETSLNIMNIVLGGPI